MDVVGVVGVVGMVVGTVGGGRWEGFFFFSGVAFFQWTKHG